MSLASYVLFPMGKKRFALRSELVTELALPHREFSFPHTTPLLTGVLLRRGHLVPVCDVARVLAGPDAPARKCYLIAKRTIGGANEWTAIPVTGECELVSAEERPHNGDAGYVVGLLSLPVRPQAGALKTGRVASSEEEVVEVVDLEQLIQAGMAEART